MLPGRECPDAAGKSGARSPHDKEFMMSDRNQRRRNLRIIKGTPAFEIAIKRLRPL
jgi:hypothetical protein